MTKTHAAMSVALTSLVMGSADPVVLAAAGAASLLPDLDTSTSILGRVFFPVSRWIEARFPHRTLTHSFLATAALAALGWPLRWAGQGSGPGIWRALVFGFFFGWFGDVFTKSGVAAFYPATAARLVIPRNPRLRLATGTRGEYFVCGLFLCLLGASAHLNTAGGLMRAFSSLLAQPESAAALFQREGARRRILATLEGRHAATGERVVMEGAEIVDVEGQTLLVRDRDGALYEAGAPQSCAQCQLQVEKVRARAVGGVETLTQELRFQDLELREVLAAISAPAGARLTLTGEITLKDAPLLVWPQSLRHFNPIQVSGSESSAERRVKLRAAGLDEASRLADHFGSGNLLIKVVKDAP
jgi:inner membrane protein